MEFYTNSEKLKKLCDSLNLNCVLVKDGATPFLNIKGGEVESIAMLADSMQGRMILKMLGK